MAKYWTPPFSPKNLYYQNGSEWPKMHFKHNFLKCKILSARPPPDCKNFTFFFFEGIPNFVQKENKLMIRGL